jgi:ABC-type lipoprotein export system ATPase subunit
VKLNLPLAMEDGTDSFVAIAVMGMTGAGKSTFIQKASGLDSVKVGHDLESCMANPPSNSWTIH